MDPIRDALRRRMLLSGLLAFAAGCTSATDHLENGIKLQNQGRYMEAAYRYADALEKDASLTEARERLIVVADSAVRVALRTSADLAERGDDPGAAEQFERIDVLVGRCREVGVSVPTPSDYATRRRAAFDRAIESFFVTAEDLRAREEWGDARRTLQRARSEFEPSAEQRERSVDAEIALMIEWGDFDLEHERFRLAFARAQEALDLHDPPDADVLASAQRIQSRALELGTVFVAVLPVTSTPQVLDAVGPDYETQLADDLELDFWREPPPFIAVADPVFVRREVRTIQRAGRPLASYEVSQVLRNVDAALGALIEFSSVEITEANVESSTHQSRLRDGRPTTFTVEEGDLVIQASVGIIVVDARGTQVESRTVSLGRRGRFSRGVFSGDPRDLELSRNEARFFDPDVYAGQLGVVEQALLTDLVPIVADRVFDAVLSRVP